MPMATRSRIPTAAPPPRNTTTAARKKNPTQPNSGTNKPGNPVSDQGSSEDDVPLAQVKGRQTKPAAKASAKTKGTTASKAPAKRTAKVAENGDSGPKRAVKRNDQTFVLNSNTPEDSLPDDADYQSCDSETEETLVPADQTTVLSLDDLRNAPPQGKIQVKPLKVAAKPQLDELEALLESDAATKRLKRNKQGLLDDDDDDDETAEVAYEVTNEEEPEPSTNLPSKGKKGKAVPSKKVPLDTVNDDNTSDGAKKLVKQGARKKDAVVTNNEPMEEASDDDASEVAKKPAKRGARRKETPLEVNDPMEAASGDDASEVAKKPAKRGARKKETPVVNHEPMEAASDDDAPEVVKKPVKRGAKKKDTPAEIIEPMEAASDDDATEVVKKPAKRGARKNDTAAENGEPAESDDNAEEVVKKPAKRGAKKNDPPENYEPAESSGDDDAEEVVKKPAKRGAKKNDPAENYEPAESSSDDDTEEVAKKPTKRGAKKPTKRGRGKKEIAEDLENLPDFMDQLNLNQDNVPAKGQKKKGGARVRSKTVAKTNRRKKEVDSEPESTTLSKYSSTESLKNITFRSGLQFKSHSEDNLNSLAGPLLDRPRRGGAPKVFNPAPDSDEEEVVVKKTRAPRRKAAK